MWNYAQERVDLILFSICRKQLDTRHQVMAPVMGSTYIMRERVKPRYQFENLFGGCMVNADGVRCSGKYGCVLRINRRRGPTQNVRLGPQRFSFGVASSMRLRRQLTEGCARAMTCLLLSPWPLAVGSVKVQFPIG